MAQNRNDPRWLTEEQAVKMGGALKLGEQGTVIACWKMDDSETATELVRPQLLLTTVYNAEQFENLTLSETVLPEKHNRVPDLLASSGVTIEHGENDKCYTILPITKLPFLRLPIVDLNPHITPWC